MRIIYHGYKIVCTCEGSNQASYHALDKTIPPHYSQSPQVESCSCLQAHQSSSSRHPLHLACQNY
uniref:Uncharacterized protein n=1 Tax=Arundo donax TaxID=35708 RepID=A0A0A9G6I7_ARUDO